MSGLKFQLVPIQNESPRNAFTLRECLSWGQCSEAGKIKITIEMPEGRFEFERDAAGEHKPSVQWHAGTQTLTFSQLGDPGGSMELDLRGELTGTPERLEGYLHDTSGSIAGSWVLHLE
jgi:hypothetical protein